MADESTNVATIWHQVNSILADTYFHSEASAYDRRNLITKANAIGGPTMQLLHWEKLFELGRIPHNDEGESVDAISGINKYGAPGVEIFMVSHRWLRPSRDRDQSHPDSVGNEKAKAINQFSLWRRKWVQERHGIQPEIYYWIDYSCISWRKSAEAIAMLPLWVACCERFLRVETEDYDERVWCRLEILLSHVFSFADHHVSIGLDFGFKWPYIGKRENAVLLDPRQGKITDPEDIKHLHPLIELSVQTEPANSSKSKVRFGESSVTCFRL